MAEVHEGVDKRKPAEKKKWKDKKFPWDFKSEKSLGTDQKKKDSWQCVVAFLSRTRISALSAAKWADCSPFISEPACQGVNKGWHFYLFPCFSLISFLFHLYALTTMFFIGSLKLEMQWNVPTHPPCLLITAKNGHSCVWSSTTLWQQLGWNKSQINFYILVGKINSYT